MFKLKLLLISALFYWFQYRPSRIKHDCSWIREYTEAIPYRPAMTEVELKDKGFLKDCSTNGNFDNWISKRAEGVRSICESDNQRLIDEYGTDRPAVSANEWWRKARSEEYQFCLHDNGL